MAMSAYFPLMHADIVVILLYRYTYNPNNPDILEVEFGMAH